MLKYRFRQYLSPNLRSLARFHLPKPRRRRTNEEAWSKYPYPAGNREKGAERGLLKRIPVLYLHLRPYRDEPSASRPIRADKHRRGQRVLTWVTSREHCAAAGFFLRLAAPATASRIFFTVSPLDRTFLDSTALHSHSWIALETRRAPVMEAERIFFRPGPDWCACHSFCRSFDRVSS